MEKFISIFYNSNEWMRPFCVHYEWTKIKSFKHKTREREKEKNGSFVVHRDQYEPCVLLWIDDDIMLHTLIKMNNQRASIWFSIEWISVIEWMNTNNIVARINCGGQLLKWNVKNKTTIFKQEPCVYAVFMADLLHVLSPVTSSNDWNGQCKHTYLDDVVMNVHHYNIHWMRMNPSLIVTMMTNVSEMRQPS